MRERLGPREKLTVFLKVRPILGPVSLLPESVSQSKSKPDRIRRERTQSPPLEGGAACIFVDRSFWKQFYHR